LIFVAKNENDVPSWKLVLDGKKIVTRRLKPMPIGKDFAVQPGRGKHAICRAVVTDCQRSFDHFHKYASNPELYQSINEYKQHEADCEGFLSWDGLMKWFQSHGIQFKDTYRIEFQVLKQ